MTTFARVLVCFLVSTCLLEHTSSLPLVPEYEDEAFNEIDFEETIPAKEYDNVDEDPDFNPEDYYDYEEYDDDDEGDNADDEVKNEEEIDTNEDQEDDDENGKDNDVNGEDEDEDDENDDCEDGKDEDKCGKRRKRDLDALTDMDEEVDPEEERRAMEFDGDRIPFGKDEMDNTLRLDEDDGFDEEPDVFEDALEPGNEDEVEENVRHEEYLPGGDDQSHKDDEDDEVNEIDSEETEEKDEIDESGIKEDIPHEDESVVEDGDDNPDEDEKKPGFVKKLKNFVKSITSFVFSLHRDKD